MNIYKTKDLGECAALITAGQRLADIEKDGKVCWFVFANKIECKKIYSEYYFGDLKLNVRDFYETTIRIKNIIYSMI